MTKTTLRKITEIETNTYNYLNDLAKILNTSIDEVLEVEEGRRYKVYKSNPYDGEVNYVLCFKKDYNVSRTYGELSSCAYSYQG